MLRCIFLLLISYRNGDSTNRTISPKAVTILYKIASFGMNPDLPLILIHFFSSLRQFLLGSASLHTPFCISRIISSPVSTFHVLPASFSPTTVSITYSFLCVCRLVNPHLPITETKDRGAQWQGANQSRNSSAYYVAHRHVSRSLTFVPFDSLHLRSEMNYRNMQRTRKAIKSRGMKQLHRL